MKEPNSSTRNAIDNERATMNLNLKSTANLVILFTMLHFSYLLIIKCSILNIIRAC